MGVAERGVRDRDPRLGAQPAGELLGTDLEQQLAAAVGSRHLQVDVRQLGRRVDAHRGRAVRQVDGHVGEVAQQLAAPVALAAGGQQLRVRLDERRGDVPAGEVGVLQDRLEEGDVRGDAADPELRDRPAGLLDRLRERASAAGQLHQHRVEVGRHLGAGVRRAAVDADARAAGGAVGRDLPGVGTEVVGRVLGGDPALQGRAPQHDRVLGEPEVGQRLAGGDPQLRLHQVDVGDLLGHGVLDLDARVHLDEDVVALGVEQELHRAGVAVADLLREPHRVRAHPVAELGVEVGGGRDLDDLLVPPLDRAVALEEVDHVALAVGEDLHLDVARVDHGLLDEDGRVAEGALGLAHAGLDGLPQVRLLVDPAHAAPAATGDGLDEERVRQLGGRRHQRVHVGGRLDRGQRRHARRLGRGDRPGLVAGEREHVGGRTDEGDAGVGARLGEGRVLREEAVAGVDRVGARPHGDRHDGLGVEVGPDRVAALADLVGLVGLEPVLGPAVLVREDGHRARTDLVRRAEGPDRDLAAVGHEHLGEHGPEAIRDRRTADRRTLRARHREGVRRERWSSGAELRDQAGHGRVGQRDRDRVRYVEHRHRLVASRGRGDQRGQPGPPLEPAGAEVPADHVLGGQRPAVPVQAPRLRHDVPVGEGVPEPPGPVERPARGRPGAPAATPTSSHHGAPATSTSATRRRDDGDAGHERAGEPPRPRPRPVAGQGDVHGAGDAEDLRGDARDDVAGGRRDQHRAALLLPVQPGHDRRDPAAAGQPQAERLAHAHPADALVVERGLPGGQQPAPQVPRAAGVREREAPVGDQVAADREGRHHAPPAATSADGTAAHSDSPVASWTRPPVSTRSNPPRLLKSWLPAPRTPAAIASPELVSGAKRSQAGSRRSTTRSARATVRHGGRHGAPGRRGDVQQLLAQPPGAGARQPVQVEPVLLRAGGRAGAHPDRRETEQPVDRGGGDVDGADPVQRGREHVPVEQPAPQLDPARRDPEARGHVAQHAETDRDADTDEAPGTVVARGGGAGDEEADQDRQEADQLPDRVDQQHPRVEPLPVLVARELAHRRLTSHRPRSRPPSGSARRPAAGRGTARARRSPGRRPTTPW